MPARIPIARAQLLSRPETSYAPFWFFEAVPWLLLAETIRIVGANVGLLVSWLALIPECVCVLMAFNAVARRAFPLFGFPAPLNGMPLAEELHLSLRTFWRVLAMIVVAAVLAGIAGLKSDAPYFMWGIAGIAFNQLSFIGRIWSAVTAALVLLMLLDADRSGAATLTSAVRSVRDHGVRFCATIAALAIFYVGWGTVQILLFNAIWTTPALGAADPRTKGLIFFAVTFVFAFARLWMTLLILTSGLTQAAGGRQAATAAPSSCRP